MAVDENELSTCDKDSYIPVKRYPLSQTVRFYPYFVRRMKNHTVFSVSNLQIFSSEMQLKSCTDLPRREIHVLSTIVPR